MPRDWKLAVGAEDEERPKKYGKAMVNQRKRATGGRASYESTVMMT